MAIMSSFFTDFGMIFVWLFLSAVLYGALSQIKLFTGKDEKSNLPIWINLIVAATASFLAVSTKAFQDFVFVLTPYLFILVLFAFFVVLIFMFFGVSKEEIQKAVALEENATTIVVIIIILFVIVALKQFGVVSISKVVLGNTYILGLVLFFVIAVATIKLMAYETIGGLERGGEKKK